MRAEPARAQTHRLGFLPLSKLAGSHALVCRENSQASSKGHRLTLTLGECTIFPFQGQTTPLFSYNRHPPFFFTL